MLQGVATYALELFTHVSDLECIYVLIGLGSGICSVIAVRNELSPKTKVIGVVSSHARAYALSFSAKQCVEAAVSTELADGMACRTPHPEALEIIWKYVDEIVEVSDQDIMQAMQLIYQCTHNCAEGAGAASLAAIMKNRHTLKNKRVAAVLTGGNVDTQIFANTLLANTNHF